MTNLLTEQQIAEQLADLPAWTRVGDEIRAEFTAADFVDAVALVTTVADRAEEAAHHPDIDIRYNKVTFVLSTHSAGGLTSKDFELAGEISRAAGITGAPSH